MKLTRMKCSYLSRARDIIITDDYIIGYTGKKAVILDHSLNLIHDINGLEFVYSGRLSPDSKKLLLISNSNKFYILDLVTFRLTKVIVKSPYNYNLDGQGCWSLDGRRIYIPVQNSETLNSALRCYDTEDISQYYDTISEKYCLTGVVAAEKYGKYFLTGYDRERNNLDVLIHYDGDTCVEYPLPARKGDIVSKMEFDPENDEVLIYGFVCKRYKTDGSFLGVISHVKPKQRTISLGTVIRSTKLDKIVCDQDHRDEFEEFLKQPGKHEFQRSDSINKYGVSKNGKMIYLASESGFYVLDPKTKSVILEHYEEFGVTSYHEIGENILALSTANSVKLFQMEEGE